MIEFRKKMGMTENGAFLLKMVGLNYTVGGLEWSKQ